MSADAAVSAAELAQCLEGYLALHPEAAVLEDGRVLFDLRLARYSVSEQYGRCVLQLWSDERNLTRTVVEATSRKDTLRLLTRRMGVAKPQAFEVVPSCDRRTPSARESARRQYMLLLQRVLERAFFGARVDGLRNAMDLENSFGPAFVRGRLLQGPEAVAIIGVSAAESAATIDGILTLGLLWLEQCRLKADARRNYGVLKIILPAGTEATTASRLPWIRADLGRIDLYTLDENSEEFSAVESSDQGNLVTRLPHSFAVDATLARCRAGVDRLIALLPEGASERIELRANSATEVGLLLHGLEFARTRMVASTTSFQMELELSFGAGPSETMLTDESESLYRSLTARLFESRHPLGSQRDPLFRLQSEHWIESELRKKLDSIFPEVSAERIYTQLPSLSTTQHGLLDLLAIDRKGRLVIIEVKAEEDLHLPLQALDYWICVQALLKEMAAGTDGTKLQSAFERGGYFQGHAISAQPPRLVMVAPALRIHPTNERILRSLAPEVEWELVALGEDWRRSLQVVFRKHSQG